MRLLLVEDETDLRQSLAAGLTAAGYAVDAAADGEVGWWHAHTTVYDTIILDRMLPGRSGIAMLRDLRARGRDDPVLLLTALDTVEHRVEGLQAGADDYLVKPFAADELLARVRALVRRGRHHADPVLRCGVLALDTVRRRVRVGGRLLDVPPRELALLEVFILRLGETLGREALAEHLYNAETAPDSNLIDVLVGRLRRRLAAAGAGDLIHTRRGHGYALLPPGLAPGGPAAAG
jgi:two-component system copper resistance phosphate regulon response regulator CusR